MAAPVAGSLKAHPNIPVAPASGRWFVVALAWSLSMCLPAEWSSAATGPAQAVLAGAVTETFDGTAMPSAWRSDGGRWQLEGGRLIGEPPARGDAILWLGDRHYHDVAVELDLAFTQAADPTRWFAIVVREAEDKPGVQLTLRRNGTRSNGVEVATRRPGVLDGWRVLQTAKLKAAVGAGEVQRVRLEAAGRRVRGFINGTEVIRTIRADEASPDGRVGLRLSGVSVQIDNLKITPLEATSDMLKTPRVRPLVIAHRGFSWVAPENTLASYRLAMEAGAEMAECDVYLTSDGVPILLHDTTLERTTGVKARPGERTLEQLRKLDAGSWKSPKYAGERIPTLQETLELVKGRMRLVIEIKEAAIAGPVLEAVRAAGVQPQDVMVFSFHRRAVEEIRRLEPLAPTTWLLDDPTYDPQRWREIIRDALQSHVCVLGMERSKVDPAFVRLAHESGLPVFVWTVNDPEDMRYLIGLGVDGIITDRPDVLLGILDGAP